MKASNREGSSLFLLGSLRIELIFHQIGMAEVGPSLLGSLEAQDTVISCLIGGQARTRKTDMRCFVLGLPPSTSEHILYSVGRMSSL